MMIVVTALHEFEARQHGQWLIECFSYIIFTVLEAMIASVSAVEAS